METLDFFRPKLNGLEMRAYIVLQFCLGARTGPLTNIAFKVTIQQLNWIIFWA